MDGRNNNQKEEHRMNMAKKSNKDAEVEIKLLVVETERDRIEVLKALEYLRARSDLDYQAIKALVTLSEEMIVTHSELQGE
jgi:hypothetical protein